MIRKFLAFLSASFHSRLSEYAIARRAYGFFTLEHMYKQTINYMTVVFAYN